jgi:acetyl-CoA carboxylase carboxyltransferase component
VGACSYYAGMDWAPEVAEIEFRQSLARQLGGEEQVARHRARGKLTIRERIDLLCDQGSFDEIGSLTGTGAYDSDGATLLSFRPTNFVAGVARVLGRPCVVSGDDYTVRGGSDEGNIKRKRDFPERIAIELAIPHVRLIDGQAGGGSVKSIEKHGFSPLPGVDDFHAAAQQLSVSPSVSLALGTVAGAGAVRVVMSHYSVIVRGTAQMMIAGPALVEQASLGQTDREQLGDASVHTSNGSIDDLADTELEAFERARQFLSYLPDNVWQAPARTETDDPVTRSDESLLSAVPRNPREAYDMRKIVRSVVDRDSWFEFGRGWGKPVMTGFARLDGWPVAVFAEDPGRYGGAWTAQAARKVRRLVDLASTFHLPLIHLQDCPGLMIGPQSERDGTVREATSALLALSQSTSDYCSVVIRRAFGVGGSANKKLGATHFRFAWPSGDWGSLPVEGGIESAYRAELAELDERASQELVESVRNRLARYRSPFRSAEAFDIEEVIDPRETRTRLCRWAHLVCRAARPRALGPAQVTYRP